MATPVIINFTDSYNVEKTSDDLKNGFFTIELQEGGKEMLKIEISNNPRPGQSSLHDIIRTPEQAERFMRLLKFAEENPPNPPIS